MARNDNSDNSNSNSGMTDSKRDYLIAVGKARRAAKRYRAESEAFKRGVETYKGSLEKYKVRKGEYVKEYTPWFKTKARAGIKGTGLAFVGKRPVAPRTLKKKKAEYVGETKELSTKQTELKGTQVKLKAQQQKVSSMYETAKKLAEEVPKGYMVKTKGGEGYDNVTYTTALGFKYLVKDGELTGVEDPFKQESRIATPTDIIAFKGEQYKEKLYEQQLEDSRTWKADIPDFTTWQKIKFEAGATLSRETPELYHGVKNIPSGWRETERTASGFVKKVTPEHFVAEPLRETLPGRFFEGAYEGLREKPLTTAVTYGAFKLALPILSGASRVLSTTRAGAVVEQTIGLGMGVTYAANIGSRMYKAGDPIRELGKISSTEILPMGLAFKSSKYDPEIIGITKTYKVGQPQYKAFKDIKVMPKGLRQVPIVEERLLHLGPFTKQLSPRATWFEPILRGKTFPLKSGQIGFRGTMKLKQMPGQAQGIKPIKGLKRQIVIEKVTGKAKPVPGKKDMFEISTVSVTQRGGLPTTKGTLSKSYLTKRKPSLLESRKLRLKVRRGEPIKETVEFDVLQNIQNIRLRKGTKGTVWENVFDYKGKVGKPRLKQTRIEVQKKGIKDLDMPKVQMKDFKTKPKVELESKITKPEPIKKVKPKIETDQVVTTYKSTYTEQVPQEAYTEVLSGFAEQKLQMYAGQMKPTLQPTQTTIKPIIVTKTPTRVSTIEKTGLKVKSQLKSKQVERVVPTISPKVGTTLKIGLKERTGLRTPTKTKSTTKTFPGMVIKPTRIKIPEPKPPKPKPPKPFKFGKQKRIKKKKVKSKSRISRMAKYKPSLIGLTMPEVTGIKPKKLTGIEVRRVFKK